MIELDANVWGKQLVAALKNNAKYADIDMHELNGLAAISGFIDVKKNDYVYRENDKTEYFYIIVTGIVEIFKNSLKGRERIFAKLYPGDEFALPELCDEYRSHTVNVICLVDCVIARIRGEDLFPFLMLSPQLTLKLMWIHSNHLGVLQRDMVTSNAEKRLLIYIKFLMNKVGRPVGDTVVIDKKINIDHLSKQINATRETLSRMISRLELERIIRKEKNSITVLNIDAVDGVASDVYIDNFYNYEK